MDELDSALAGHPRGLMVVDGAPDVRQLQRARGTWKLRLESFANPTETASLRLQFFNFKAIELFLAPLLFPD